LNIVKKKRVKYEMFSIRAMDKRDAKILAGKVVSWA